MSDDEVRAALPKVFGVLGYPVAHSRSPAMHRAAMQVLGLPHDYRAFSVKPADLEAALTGARALGFGGLNLTVPHKRAATGLVDALTETAKRIGAVNTVLIEQARIVGDNTDALGFARAVRELGGPPIRRAVVLGAGGASRAIIDALRRPPKPPANTTWEPLREAVRITWVSRRVAAMPSFAGVNAVAWDVVNEVIQEADLLVNATTVGMEHGPVGFPVPIDPSKLPASGRVIDIVYPRPTWGLLDAAAAAGKPVQDGLPMLLWQGVAALERWLGKTLPDEAVAAMRQALGNGSGETGSHL